MLARAWRNLTGSTGRDLALWPVLSLLALVVLSTAGGFLWLLEAATRNARLAARQQVADAYALQLPLAADGLAVRWTAELARLDGLAQTRSPAESFARLVADPVVDSGVVFEGDSPAYPQPAAPRVAAPDPPGWSAATALEFQQRNYAAAAAAYERIAQAAAAAERPEQSARALQARARCLALEGRIDQAVEVLEQLAHQAGRDVRDEHGRLVSADAELRIAQLLGQRDELRARQAADRVANLVYDYGSGLPSAQRRFLMGELATVSPDTRFPVREAETLAADWLARQPRPDTAGLVWLADLSRWQARTPSGRALLLFASDTLAKRLETLLADDRWPAAARLVVAPPGADLPTDLLAASDLGPAWPGWRLATVLRDPALFDSSTRQASQWYAWAVALLIAGVTLLALLAAWAVRHQVRLAGLKNDLAATVSHELRTPLASMRVLVDTLLDATQTDERQTREYLQLISAENQRLSRLIENFLVFSRLSRGKQRFDFRPLRPEQVAAAALAAVQERFEQPGCELATRLEAKLPAVRGDFDALVTVLVNLLDNAYKYTGERKQVALRCYTERGQVCFAVSDNGHGMTRRVARRVFDRFYQGDQSLSRGAGGCGLGLSIVQAFVAAHGGQVSVASEPGHGSTFAVRLPATAPSAQIGAASQAERLSHPNPS